MFRPEASEYSPEDEYISRFSDALQICCTREICYPGMQESWNPEYPLWGCCGAIAEVVRRSFGGKLLTATMTGSDGQKFKHYWNLLSDGRELDFVLKNAPCKIINIGKIVEKDKMNHKETLQRVKNLENRLEETLRG